MGSPTPRRAAPFFEIASQAPTSAEGEQQLHIRRPTANPRRSAERPRLRPQRKAGYVPITHNGEKRATLQYHTTAKRLRSNICGGRATAPYDGRRQTLAGARSARAKSELRSQNNITAKSELRSNATYAPTTHVGRRHFFEIVLRAPTSAEGEQQFHMPPEGKPPPVRGAQSEHGVPSDRGEDEDDDRREGADAAAHIPGDT